jgi:hypothetical protein
MAQVVETLVDLPINIRLWVQTPVPQKRKEKFLPSLTRKAGFSPRLLTSQEQNRLSKRQFLNLLPPAGWSHSSSTVLCHLMRAAAFACLLSLRLGKSRSQIYNFMWEYIFLKMLFLSFSQSFLPFCSWFPLILRINKKKILTCLFLQLISCDFTIDNDPVVSCTRRQLVRCQC